LDKSVAAYRAISDTELETRVSALPWFHQIDLGNGILTPGSTSLEHLQAVADIFFERGLAGKTVLDIGAYDGFFSLEAKRRGATRVLATEFHVEL
jgi:tRNA (mo5U34)-methyltransferase